MIKFLIVENLLEKNLIILKIDNIDNIKYHYSNKVSITFLLIIKLIIKLIFINNFYVKIFIEDKKMKRKKLMYGFLSTLFLLGCTSNANKSSSSIDSTLSSSNQSSQSSNNSSPNTSNSSIDSSIISSNGSINSSISSSISSSLPEISYVQVFAPVHYTHIYAWVDDSNGTKELLGSWPGTKMKNYDQEWNTYDFVGYTSVNFIFNIGSNQDQTQDLSANGAGYYWYYDGQLHSDNNTNLDPDDDDNSNNYVEVDSWKDFGFWNEYPSSYWTTINKYQGKRKDFRNESIYFAITTRFYDGDSTNNVECWDGRNPNSDPAWRGDFKGLIEKMDYIKALGFTSIWITPVVENASGYDYHGYHALNFNKIDERYLSEDVSFQDVINEAHKRDMKIVLDVVFNHTGNFGESNLFPMFTKVGDPGSFDSMNRIEEGPLPSNYDNLPAGQQYDARINAMKTSSGDPNDIYHHYGNFSWETFGEQVAQIAGDCVDLNTENPIVAEYLVKAYGNFIKMGVDAFRIDTMKHISRLTWNNYIFPALYEFAARCGNSNFFMFGEVCTRVREVWNRNIPALSAPFFTWKEEKEYPWGDKDTNLKSIEEAYNDNKEVNNERTSKNALLNSNLSYHTPDYSASSGVGVIDFPMHWNFQYAQDAFNVAVNNDQYYNDSTYNVMYVDSHDYGPDGISTVRYNMGKEAWAENLSLMFTFRGIPCLYYGSEVEFQKGMPIDTGPNSPLSETGRAYFGDYLEGQVNASDFGVYQAEGEVKNTLNQPLAQHLIKLNQIRQAIPCLSLGQYTTSGVEGNMAYIRRYTNESIDSLALICVSSKAKFNNIPNGTYVDVVTGSRKNVTNNTLTSDNISKGNLRVYVLENQSTGSLSKIGNTTTYLK